MAMGLPQAMVPIFVFQLCHTIPPTVILPQASTATVTLH